ncbi:hypothetical protein EI94DRAFT_1705967 [Lactarius quietus]|nr:hypothetical protein EI94DRAFT_1705967 [Lactarius quietus]
MMQMTLGFKKAVYAKEGPNVIYTVLLEDLVDLLFTRIQGHDDVKASPYARPNPARNRKPPGRRGQARARVPRTAPRISRSSCPTTATRLASFFACIGASNGRSIALFLILGVIRNVAVFCESEFDVRQAVDRLSVYPLPSPSIRSCGAWKGTTLQLYLATAQRHAAKKRYLMASPDQYTLSTNAH